MTSLVARKVMHHLSVPFIFLGALIAATTAIGWRHDLQDFYPPAWITLISSSLAVVAGAWMMQLVYHQRWKDRKRNRALYPPSGHYTTGSFLIWATVLIGALALALVELAPALCECDDPSIFPEILVLLIPMALLASGAIALMRIPQDAPRLIPPRQTIHGFSIVAAALGSSMLLASSFRALVVSVDLRFIVWAPLSILCLALGASGLAFIYRKAPTPNPNFTVGSVLVVAAVSWILTTVVALN